MAAGTLAPIQSGGVGCLVRSFLLRSLRSSSLRRLRWACCGGWGFGCGRWRWSYRGGGRFGGDQDFGQAYIFRLLHLVPVLVIKLLFVLFGDGEFSPDFFADNFAGNDLVFLLLLEVFPRDTLFFRFLLERFEIGELHLFTHLVKLLNQVGIAGDVEIFAFFQEQLLVDEVAKDILLLVGIDLVGAVGILLLGFVAELVLTAGVLGAGDDLVVDAGNDLLDHLSGRKGGQTRQSNKR